MTQGPLIRPARPEDAEAITALLNPIFATGRHSAITDPIPAPEKRAWLEGLGPRDLYHLAEVDGRLVGLQWLEPFPGASAHAGDIASFADPAARGTGVGRALLEATIA
ncbi:MAG: GNAT family N-acetyltransferase, partial [Pseudomonadota bacterium]